MTRLLHHPCALAPDCDQQVPVGTLMCSPDWDLVPPELKQEIHRTYQARQDNWGAYQRAVDAATAAARQARHAQHEVTADV